MFKNRPSNSPVKRCEELLSNAGSRNKRSSTSDLIIKFSSYILSKAFLEYQYFEYSQFERINHLFSSIFSRIPPLPVPCPEIKPSNAKLFKRGSNQCVFKCFASRTTPSNSSQIASNGVCPFSERDLTKKYFNQYSNIIDKKPKEIFRCFCNPASCKTFTI